MIFKKISQNIWGISDVIWVFLLRLMFVYLFSKIVLPLISGISPRLVEILDRVILLSLTFYFVSRKSSIDKLGFHFNHLGRQVLYGVIGGGFLFALAEGTQRALVAFLVADISTNPLVKAAAGAKNFSDLLWPLLIAGLLVPFTEEVYYRGMALRAFANRWGWFLGIIISALFFSLAHLSGIWFVQIAAVGVGLAVIYSITGSLLPGIIAHGLVNSSRLLMVYFSS
ncbi:Abortive infection protein [Desulforamulus reducens MI-1]|uniref:Abortive infection protein n=1 Tax=Desulforamulus reducens (strain ATCC BAA-1160 / DSM 100696 / MI-1) TaxID=349161 RepID=A4J6Y4_DESRM|nr:type II CAAX endopeptidase family protein [Desulforamulus reducens]ABO50837.1 Abortive infection protein [Desulforamulus reducens MI-1]